jgi:hypothetical protein
MRERRAHQQVTCCSPTAGRDPRFACASGTRADARSRARNGREARAMTMRVTLPLSRGSNTCGITDFGPLKVLLTHARSTQPDGGAGLSQCAKRSGLEGHSGRSTVAAAYVAGTGGLAPSGSRFSCSPKPWDQARSVGLVGAVCVAEDAVELGFLDMDAPHDGRQGQSHACRQRRPVP